MKIAVLDANPAQLKIICSIVNSAGLQALAFSSEKELLHHLRGEPVDMLILDAGAVEIIVSVKEKYPTLPILFITTRFAEDEIVGALTAGAMDYMIKPLRRIELMTRVQVLLLRAYPHQAAPENLKFGRYVFETRSARIALSGQFIELTRKEFELALLLFRNLGRPLSRAYMLDAVWSRESDIPSRTLDTHISRVRTKLQLRAENGFQLVPVYSYGYQLEQVGSE